MSNREINIVSSSKIGIQTGNSILKLTILAFLLSFTISCNGNDSKDGGKRNLTVRVLVPRSYDVQQSVSDALGAASEQLFLNDGTQIAISLISESDLAARELVATGVIKPHLWLALHPALTDISLLPTTTFAVTKFACTALAESTLINTGLPFNAAKLIRVANPSAYLSGLLPTVGLGGNISKVVAYPSEKILDGVPRSKEEARINAVATVPENMDPSSITGNKLQLSSCLATSDLFSAREAVAAEIVQKILQSVKYKNFASVPEANFVAQPLEVEASLENWRTHKPKRHFIILVDSSSSMKGRNLAIMQTITDKFLTSVSNADRVSFVSYNAIAKSYEEALPPPEILKSLKFDLGDALFDGVDLAMTLMDKTPTTLLVFADYHDTRSPTATEKKLSLAASEGLQVYGFTFGEQAMQQVSKLAALTGGIALPAEEIQSALTLAEAIAR